MVRSASSGLRHRLILRWWFRRSGSALGVQEVPNRPLLDTLLAYLKNKSLLLIFDNCEHVITEAATVAGALAACPNIRILATSREPLRAAGEHVYRLPSLPVPSAQVTRTLSAADAVEYGAIVLFTNRAPSCRVSLRNHRWYRADGCRPLPAPGRHSIGYRACSGSRERVAT